jgi:hypothetical protein
MSFQVFFVPPEFLEHDHVLYLHALVDTATDTPRLKPAPFSHRTEDFQHFTPPFCGYQHPYGPMNHQFLLLPILIERFSRTFSGQERVPRSIEIVR